MSSRSICGSISRFAGVAAAASLLLGPAPAGAAGSQSQYAVAYQINPAHSGKMASPTGAPLAPPLTLSWSRNLGGPISYPLIAEGMVFVTVGNNGGYGTQIFALDLLSGDIVYQKPVAGTYFWSNAAYDAERIFVVNFDGLLQAFTAVNGVPAWSNKLPDQYAFSSPPTAAHGRVFVGGAGSGGTLYSVNEKSGALEWTASVANGDNSSPALGDGGVYVSYPCQVYKFGPKTGSALWHYNGGCDGGGGKTAVYHNDRLYVRDSVGSGDLVFDAGTGGIVGGFSARAAPALFGRHGFELIGSTLYAVSLDTGNARWTFAGDGGLTTAPIVFGKAVFVGSDSGELYMLDPMTGAVEWSTNVGSPIPGPDEQNVSQPLTGLGAGQGTLVVPAGSQISAYVPEAALAGVR